ncbi:MAG: SdpI family protein [Candidatus Binataceae bacterium]
MRFNWRTEWPQWLVIAAMFTVAALSWSTAPEQFPVHWNVYGAVDRYGSRSEGVMLLPLLRVAIYALFVILPRIDPGRSNYAQFGGVYATVRLFILIFLGVVYALMQLVAHGYQINLAMIAVLGESALLIVFGNYMSKIRPNWFFGIRTPWTLSSKLSRDRTHRVGGWLFVVGGIVSAASVVLPPVWSTVIMLAVLVSIVIATAVYSYLVWRTDPDKQPPAGTLPARPA